MLVYMSIKIKYSFKISKEQVWKEVAFIINLKVQYEYIASRVLDD